MNNVVDNIPIANTSEPIIVAQKSFAVSVQKVDPETFRRLGQTFSVNIADFTQQNISSEDLSFDNNAVSPPTSTIQLPSNLFSSLPENSSRISHAVFVTDSLFLRRSFSYRRVSSIIISASVVGAGTIKNLRPPVNLGFQLNPVRVAIVILLNLFFINFLECHWVTPTVYILESVLRWYELICECIYESFCTLFRWLW